MRISVEPSFISGEIKAPPSKSMTQRAIAAATLAKGESLILNPSYCDDSLAAIRVARKLGASMDPSDDRIKARGSHLFKEGILDCGESGLAIRMFSPIAALHDKEMILTGSGTLIKRPMNIIGEALVQMGVQFRSNNGFVPVTIKGPLKGGACEIDGSLSSQLLTGMLMALPLAQEDSEIRVRNLKSKPYIDLTIGVLGDFGVEVSNDDYETFRVRGMQNYRPSILEVEGDWSGGAFLLVAGAISGNLKVTGLRASSFQSDKAILEALENAGAEMIVSQDSVEIRRSGLRAFEFDATESPDLFPPLVALASFCKGSSRIKGASRLAHKESDRAAVLSEEFGKMNIRVTTERNYIVITGGNVKGAEINSHGDHRIAMAGAVAALGAAGAVHITDPQCVAKSYPGFFDDLKKAGAPVVYC